MFLSDLSGVPAAAATAVLLNPQEQQWQVQEEGDPEVGSPFMDFMGKPFMGLWNPNSKFGRALEDIEFQFPDSKGDNNHHDAPEEDFY